MKNLIFLTVMLLFCLHPFESIGGRGKADDRIRPSDKVNLPRAEYLISRLPAGDPWVNSPGGNTLAWGESYTLGAFVDLYEATKDPQYLELVASRGRDMLSHRDDKRGVTDGSGHSRPAWSVAANYTVAVGELLSSTGEVMLKIRSAASSENNSTTVEVIHSETPGLFTLLVRNEEIGRYETFNNLDLSFSESYIIDRINDPLATYQTPTGNFVDQGSSLIRIEEVNTNATGVLANQKITLDPIPLAFAGYVGVIYYPLMRFAEIVKGDPALSNFLEDANLFIQAAEESYADISARLWRTGPQADEGYYLMCEKGESMPADNVGQPFNYLGKHVCTELALYRLTNKQEYRDRATRIINLFKNRLSYDRVNSLYVWNYWYEPMTTTGWTPEDNLSYNTKVFVGRAALEDLSHGGHDIEMVMAAYRMGIGFTETDVRRFARTFLKNGLTPDRQKITRFVDGTGDYQAYFIAIFQWFGLGEVNPEVVKAGLDIYENRTEENIRYTARLLKYEHLWDAEDNDPEFVGITPNSEGIVFVKQGSFGDTGDSWENAIPELADALKVAKTNLDIKEIWVAKGVYKPLFHASTLGEDLQDRNNAFVLTKDVKLYGGFDPDNGITGLADRVLPSVGEVLPANATILSGDIDNNDISDDGNAYHVVVSVGDVGTAMLDGFVITGGYANGTDNIVVNGVTVLPNYGAGVFVRNSSPTFSHVSIVNNVATSSVATYGGGMYSNAASPILTNVIVMGNTASSPTAVAYGGGIYSVSSSPVLTHVSLLDNTASSTAAHAYGGGLYAATASSPVLTNVVIKGNTASTSATVAATGAARGGGIFSNGSSPVLTNVLVAGNTISAPFSTAQGGGLYTTTTEAVYLTVTNVTVSGNTAAGTAVAATEWYNLANSQIRNTIVYGTSVTPGATYTDDNAQNSLIQGRNVTANGNIAANTIGSVNDLFVDPANGDYRLKESGIVIDKGNNSLFAGLDSDTKDLAGNPRVYNGTIDFGAYEYFVANIQSLTDPEPIQLEYGSSWADIQALLPTHVAVTLSNDAQVNVPLVEPANWVPTGSGYDGNTFGDYVYTAALVLPAIDDNPYFTNTDDLKATITLRVRNMLDVTLENVSYIYDGTPKSLSITGSLPAGISPPVYTIDGQPGNTATDVGVYTVVVYIDGGSEYHDLTLSATMSIQLETRTITFAAIPEKTYSDADFSLVATASSGETVLYIIDDPSIATIEGDIVKILGAGETIVSATVPEDPHYGNTPIEQQRLVVRKAPQQIDFTMPAKVARNVGKVFLPAVASSGLPVTLELEDTSRGTLEGNELYVNGGLGAIRITATQSGDDNFEAATPVNVVIHVVEESLENLVRLYPAVSPNGDGINDVLVIVGIRDYPENKLVIHDSEGRIVFEAEGYDNSQTVFTGEGVEDGTYYYRLEVTINGERKHAKGFLQVKRN